MGNDVWYSAQWGNHMNMVNKTVQLDMHSQYLISCLLKIRCAISRIETSILEEFYV